MSLTQDATLLYHFDAVSSARFAALPPMTAPMVVLAELINPL